MSSVWNTAESLLFGSSDVAEKSSTHQVSNETGSQHDEHSQEFTFQNTSSAGGYSAPTSSVDCYSRDDLRTSVSNAPKAKVLKGRNHRSSASSFGNTGINVTCTTPSESLSRDSFDIVGIDNSSGNSFLGNEPIPSSNSEYCVAFESSNSLMNGASTTVGSHVTVGSGNISLQSSRRSAASVSTGFIPSFEEVKKQIGYTEKKRRGRGRGAVKRAGNSSSCTRKQSKNLGYGRDTLTAANLLHLPVDNSQFLNDNDDHHNDDREQNDDSNIEVDDDDEDDNVDDGGEAIDVCGDDDTELNISSGHSTDSDSDDYPVGQTSAATNVQQHQGISSNPTNGICRPKEFLVNTSESGRVTSVGNSAPARGGRGVGRPRGSRGGGRGRGRGYLPPAVAEGLARHKAVQQRVYKMKYKQMKTFTRSLVLENAALCDLVADVQQKIVLANEKRRFLLKKLHAVMVTTTSHNKDDPFQHLDSSALGLLETRSPTDHTTNGSMFGGTTSTHHITNGNTKNSYACSGGALVMVAAGGSAGASAVSTNTVSTGDRSRSHPHITQKKTRGGRRGAGGVGKSKRLCPPITLDSAGRPLFPICLGPLTIHSLGEIVSERPAYHRVHVIYPVGFCSSRTYASVTRPTQAATYTCKILDAVNVPRFELVCEEPETGEERVFSGSSPSDCHNMVLAAINSAHGMPKGVLQPTAEVNSISDRGLRFFGLSHPSVQNVLQACPGARKCVNYHWIKFEVCRSESEVDKVLEAERDTGLCHETLLRNIRFAAQAL